MSTYLKLTTAVFFAAPTTASIHFLFNHFHYRIHLFCSFFNHSHFRIQNRLLKTQLHTSSTLTSLSLSSPPFPCPHLLVLVLTSLSSDLSSETMSSSPPTKDRTISPASFAFSMQGQIAQAADAWTSGF